MRVVLVRLRRPRPRGEKEKKEPKEELGEGALGTLPGCSRQAAESGYSSATQFHKRGTVCKNTDRVNRS